MGISGYQNRNQQQILMRPGKNIKVVGKRAIAVSTIYLL
jgi:hypothetical protein